jgi:hypothetical protein
MTSEAVRSTSSGACLMARMTSGSMVVRNCRLSPGGVRQQINVLRRTAPKKQTFSGIDRLIFVSLYRLLPGVRDALAIVKPETVVKAFPSDRTDQPFSISILPRGARRRGSIAPGTFFVAQSWADCITNMAGFNLRQAQAVLVQPSAAIALSM